MIDAAPAPHQHGWFRRNLPPLAVIVIAASVLAFVVIGLPIIDDAGREQSFRALESEEAATSHGYTFTLTDSAEFVGTGRSDEGNGIPIGSSIVAARIVIEPASPSMSKGEKSVYCESELTGPVAGNPRTNDRRRWTELSTPREYGYGVADDSSTFCSLDGESLVFEAVYLTPGGAYDSATIDLVVGGDGLRFELVH